MIHRNEVLPAIIGFMIALSMNYVILLWRDPAPIAQYHEVRSPTAIWQDQLVTVSWKEIRNEECDSIVRRSLIDAAGKVVEFETVNSPAKPVDVEVSESFQFKVPRGLKSGMLIYRSNIEFRCNFVQRFLGGHVFIMPDIIFFYTDTTVEGFHK